MIRKDHSTKNAVKNMYYKKYQLDKDFGFKVPRLKTDLEAYLHRLLNAVEEALDEAKVTKYKGHQLTWPTYADNSKKDNSDD